MSDIFQEVDEELRRERLKSLWDRYGALLVGAAFLVVAGVGGFRAYQWWDAKQAAENGARFEEARALETKGDHAAAEAAFARIAAEGTSGYRLISRFQEAAEIARRDQAAAVKLYDGIAADSSVPATMQELARVRAALLLVDTAPYSDITTRLEAAAAPDKPFRHTARELLAMSAWRANDAAATTRWYEAVMADNQSPPATRNRVEVLVALTNAGAKS